MSYAKNENQFTELQLVEIDQSKFAVEMKDGNMSVNLSKMALPFGKKPMHWLRTNPAKEYLNIFAVLHKSNAADLVKVIQGGTPDEQGTWVTDPRIAIRFAQWLSPAFAIKVDETLIGILLNRPEKQKAIVEQTGYKEGEVFLTRLGKLSITGSYINGKLYYQASKIMKHLGYEASSGALYIINYSPENALKLNINEKVRGWFINMDAIEILLKRSKRDIPYESIAILYRDLFNIIKMNNDKDTINYTESELVPILADVAMISDEKLRRSLVNKLMRRGK